MLFQGYELMDWRPWSDVTDMDWPRAGRFAAYRRFHRDLIRARTNADGRTRGLCGSSASVIAANPDTKVLAYQRWDQGGGADDVVVIANFSGTTFPSYRVGLPYPGTWYVRLNSDANVYSDVGDFGATACDDAVAELVHRHVGRVDHKVGGLAKRLEHRALLRDAVEHPIGQRVLPLRRLEPPEAHRRRLRRQSLEQQRAEAFSLESVVDRERHFGARVGHRDVRGNRDHPFVAVDLAGGDEGQRA